MAPSANNYDMLIVGGGVIGLSLAWELAQHDARVCVVDRGPLGQEASWAGAGMVPPGPSQSHWHLATPLEQLEGLSETLHAQWYEKLLDQTGIDSQYHRCGSLQLAFTDDEASELRSRVERWRALGIACHDLDATTLADLEPALAATAEQFVYAIHMPDEAQIRNPRHLQALAAACQGAGVALKPHTEVQDFNTSAINIEEIVTSAGTLNAQKICLATGSWSGQLASRLGLELPVRPIRGQIALLEGPPGLLQRSVCVGPRYLVPRRDGHVLIGSTQEDVGFDKSTTQAAIGGLRDFAASVAPETAQLPLKSSWAGLRPATPERQPILGRLPEFENTWLATGHFRAGLQLSPATAVVMRAMLLEQEQVIDMSAFEPHATPLKKLAIRES